MNGETVLRKKRIAVVSKRRNVSDFLRLEAESCGCFVSVMPLMPPESSEYDIVMVDDDGDYIIPDGVENIYRILPDGEEKRERSFFWPVPVAAIRGVYEGCVAQTASGERETDEPVIYLSEGDEKTAVYKNRKISLSESEWRVLFCLGKAGGEPVSRETLRELLGASDGNITDVYICHLRRKLEEPSGIRLIRTVRGNGYALNARVVAERQIL